MAEIQRELKIGEIMSSQRQPVTSPWESRATGEPDFARLGGGGIILLERSLLSLAV